MQDRHSGVDIVAFVESFGLFGAVVVVVAVALEVVERRGVGSSPAALGRHDRPDFAGYIAVRHIHPVVEEFVVHRRVFVVYRRAFEDTVVSATMVPYDYLLSAGNLLQLVNLRR